MFILPRGVFAQESLTQDSSIESAPSANGAPAAALANDNPRFRFGLSTGLTLGLHQRYGRDEGGSSGAAGFALVVDTGVQFNRHLALFARWEAASVVVSNLAAAYAMVEWTPIAQLSVGTGFGIEGQASFLLTEISNWGGVSVPLAVGYNFRDKESWLRTGNTWRLGVEASVGHNLDSAFGGHGSILVGHHWM